MLSLSWLFLLLAFAGHVALFVLPINLLYGTRFRGLGVTLVRWISKTAIVAGPSLFVWRWQGELLEPITDWQVSPALGAYLLLAAVMGLAVSMQTVRRLLRQSPLQEIANHTQLLDVARMLGRKPYGHGSGWWLARFPGNQIFQVDFIEKTFRLPQLPAAWDGLSILHVSDLHLCGIPDRIFYETVLDRCVATPTDLVAVTGDILDSPDHYDWIAPVLSRLRWNVAAFAVLGNHDAWLDVPRIKLEVERAGIQMIGGRWQQRDVRGEPLVVMGNEVPWIGTAPNLGDCPEGVFRLCLSHSPDTLPWAKVNRIDLMLAGHNHGGQVRLPLIGPVLVPSRYSRRYDCGTFFEAPTLLYVSSGLGGTYPLRWNCRPEVTRIVLRK